jgi:hypothetical protein
LITFNDVLRSAGVDPARVRLARHQDTRTPGRSIYATWKSPGGPEQVEEYQAVQDRDRFEVGGFVAGFLVTPPPRNETLFIGLYQVLSVARCESGSREALTGIDVTGLYRYEMARDGRLDEYKERLVIEWGPGTRSWCQRASRQSKPIRAISDQQEPPFPGFAQFCVDVHDVPGIYPGWQERLREVKGIYVLVDKETGKQYVGSAKGYDSLWGRFSDYARTGDGGNVELKLRKGARYQIGVLQVVDLSLPDHSIEEIEGWWKRKLMSREHGLNRNLKSSYGSKSGPRRDVRYSASIAPEKSTIGLSSVEGR